MSGDCAYSSRQVEAVENRLVTLSEQVSALQKQMRFLAGMLGLSVGLLLYLIF